MKIYLLRHEDRTMDKTMFSPLTSEGLNNSQKLKKLLDEIKIDTIYSSPYLRTLQTIYPYSSSKNLEIKVDYSLSEINYPKMIPEDSYQVRMPEYLLEMFNGRDKSILQPEDFKYPEGKEDVKKRVKVFLKMLLEQNKDKNKNIIICTHQIIINIILEIANIKKEDNYPTGGLSKIFDVKVWKYEKLNF